VCGINGILYFRGAESERPDDFHFTNIGKMNRAISHRGPDGEGVFIHYPVCLGHRRLSIIDLSDAGNQPMFNEDRSLALVYNGEIYNYKELIPDLLAKGHRFSSKTDSEVVLHAYEEYGEDCVKLFNGMWAFAIYDIKNQRIFASRDRFGVKPFFYYIDSSRFIFSSECKAILTCVTVSSANRRKVFNYLAYGYRLNDGDSFFEGIKELLPAHNLIAEQERVAVSRYWDLPAGNPAQQAGTSQVRDLLFDSVSLRFRSDVPVSILLSGGIDSGIIAAVTNELVSTGMIGSFSVSSYSAVFPGYEHDESGKIKDILKACPNISGHFTTPSSEGLAESVNEFVYGMGEPVFGPTSFAHYAIMKEIASKGVKVVLNGQGSDEAWCGYDKYIIGYFLQDILSSDPGSFFRQFRSAAEKMNLSYAYITAQMMKAMMPRRTASRLRSIYGEKIYNCLSGSFAQECDTETFRNRFTAVDAGRLDSYLKFNIDHQGFNQILHYEDHSSMLNSVEIRSPFIDYRVMELAFSVPYTQRISDGIAKKLLRESFSDLLPESVSANFRKTGFATPLDNWRSDGSLKKVANDVLGSEEFRGRKIYNRKNIPINADEIKHAGFPLWRLINLELWIRAYGITNL
jgi:asparagine synthase (glutamine-hydrolysing)